MAEALIERAWAWLHATFPERQIYIRSEGRVQFFTFGSTLQATCAGLVLIFLGWVAFASVNVIFKDRIIAAKDHHYQQMQGTYENRVADLQLSYDELSGALVSAEDRFKSTADELEAKQRGVARLLGQKQIVDAALAGIGEARAATAFAPPDSSPASDSLGSDAAFPSGAAAFTVSPAVPPARPSSGSGGSQLTVMPQTVEPQPRTAKPSQASFLDETVSRIADMLFESAPATQRLPSANTPTLQVLAQQTIRLKRLSDAETGLLQGVDRTISGRIDNLHNILSRVGLNPDAVERQSPEGGVGGPFVPIQSVRIEGIADPAFTTAYENAVAHDSELSTMFAALHHVPLTTPVHGSQFEVTSGFGPRVDPFTSRIAFHPGVDFAGPWGSTVVATAPGTVVWAGARAGYGNMVEIDHGLGFHTRYGHLASTLVRVGTHVNRGSPVGRLGSTGRSTGPHVHYEVWLADVVKDPSKYIEVGRHIVQ